MRKSPRPPNARSPAARSRCPHSTSTPSAPAAARTPGAIPGARRAAGPKTPAAGPGRGGGLRTVPAANLLLGRLPVDSPLAGGLQLDRAAAERAVGELARELAIDVRACAEGIVRV